jgi:tripartite-type tricarboxylate transporter receptor subunit TctC
MKNRGLFGQGRVVGAPIGAMVALLFGIVATLGAANAQAPYPSRPIRIVVGFGPGGLADITMRLVGQKLSEITGQQVVIENRPGAGGVVAASAVIQSAPDGYTLFVLSSGIAISKTLIKTLPFDPVADFAPISTVAYFDLLILAKADTPWRTVGDMLAVARTDPSHFNVATINPGSTQNLAAELLKSTTGLNMTIVPYRSTGEVATALLRGDVAIAVESYAALKGQIDDGKLRPIASTPRRARWCFRTCRPCARAACLTHWPAGTRWWRRRRRRPAWSSSSTVTSAPSWRCRTCASA